MGNGIAAVVVTYNRKKLLKECLQSLINQTYADLDILVIDNASTDGTEQLVNNVKSKQIHYINTGKNLGGAGGFQFGIKEAVKRGYDYLWLMDDDSIPEPSALDNLVKQRNKINKWGFLSSKVLWKDDSICKMNIPKTGIYHKLSSFSGSNKKIIMATFVSFFVSTRIIREVGLPIKEFFIWADDLEYSRRISRKYPCYFVPSSVVIHKCNSNNGSSIAFDSPERLSRYNYAYRNEVYVFRREGAIGWFYLVLKWLLNSYRIIFKSKSFKIRRLRIMWSAVMHGLKFNPKIEYVSSSEVKS